MVCYNWSHETVNAPVVINHLFFFFFLILAQTEELLQGFYHAICLRIKPETFNVLPLTGLKKRLKRHFFVE